MTSLLIALNIVVCTLIAVRLIWYSKGGARHHHWASFVAYSLALAAASVPLRALVGVVLVPDLAQVIINLILCAALFSLRGNVKALFELPTWDDSLTPITLGPETPPWPPEMERRKPAPPPSPPRMNRRGRATS